jgi:hypothetical protein
MTSYNELIDYKTIMYDNIIIRYTPTIGDLCTRTEQRECFLEPWLQ